MTSIGSIPESSPVQILVVDDNPENLRLIGAILERNMECDLHFAVSGQEALQFVENTLPELILLDVIMPGLDGFEVCRRLKESPRTASVPVLFLTALTESEYIVRGFGVGAEDYISKPFCKDELVARVKTHSKIARSQRALAYHNEQLRQLVHILCHDLANPVSNIVTLLDLCEKEEDVLQALPALKDSARDGLAIINMVRQMRAMEEGKLQPTLTPVPLREACLNALENLRGFLCGKKIEVEIEVAEDAEVLAEPVALVHSVLSNVFSNAIKFSFPGQRVVARTAPAEAEEVCLEVVDEGIGIPEEILKGLFDISSQTSRPGTQGESGTGFGMILMRNFMTLFGGRIEIQTRAREAHPADHGTTVRLFFRKAASSALPPR